jgi:cytochrome c-type biogenesis protein CcmH/NrfF
MKQELLDPLVQRFGEHVLREPVYVHAFSLK